MRDYVIVSHMGELGSWVHINWILPLLWLVVLVLQIVRNVPHIPNLSPRDAVPAREHLFGLMPLTILMAARLMNIISFD